MKKIFLFLLTISCINLHAQRKALIESSGSKLYYRTFGSGAPLLIINGGPGMNSDGFVTLAKALSKNRQTIIYDQRGTGRSTVKKIDTTTITMQLMVQDLENLRKSLGYEKWAILGHSFGGMLASYYATLFPQRITSLILSSSGGIDLGLLSYVGARLQANLSAKEADSLSYWNGQIQLGDTSYYARLQRAKFLAPAYVYNKQNIPIVAERLTRSNSKLNSLVWQNLQRIGFNCSSGLSSFSQPVLIIQGRQDIIEEATARKAEKAFKNATVILLDRCRHYGWLDRPDEYYPAIENFLRDK